MLASGRNSFGTIQSENNNRVDLNIVSPSRILQNSSGGLIRFDGEFPITHNPCAPSTCAGVANLAAVFAAAGGSGGGVTPGTAVVIESGSDPQTGVSWGRWGSGTMAVGNRTVGGTNLTTADLSANNWHYLLTGPQSGPVTLPVSGTFNYTFVGGTAPTNNLGQSGVLNAATLAANFTARTVDVGVNLTIAGQPWSASASGVPILKDTAFMATRTASGNGTLNVTANGSTSNVAGQISGGFSGPTGNGAGFAYSLNQGGNAGTTVNGVAAFRR
jgi:hypothetical protein